MSGIEHEAKGSSGAQREHWVGLAVPLHAEKKVGLESVESRRV